MRVSIFQHGGYTYAYINGHEACSKRFAFALAGALLRAYKGRSIVLVTVILFLLAMRLNAQEYTASPGDTIVISWEQPRTWENGSALEPLQDISHYSIFFRHESNTWAEVDTPLVRTPPADSLRAEKRFALGLVPGSYQIVVTATGTNGMESKPSYGIWLRIVENRTRPARPQKVEILIKRRHP